MRTQETEAAPQPPQESVAFTLSGALSGARQAIPIAIGVFAYGLVFGLLARQTHLSAAEALLMSGLVFAGASQFVALGLWSAPLPIGLIVGATLVVNLRLLLMGAALRPWFARLSPLKTYSSAFFIADENWALTMGQFARGGRDAAFLLGSGLALFTAWIAATLAGRALGGVMRDPVSWGLDFAFTAIFIALLVGLWKDRSDILPWAVAAVVAVAGAQLLPGKWYILLGGIAGSVTGALRHED